MPKKLIEVAMPVKEVSAESVRDSRIQHGHISSVHKWWARRPLPVCRAVVFASLVPDPLDTDCSTAFKDAVELLLGKETNPSDPYKPYSDIPYTSAIDKMEDNLRNRLLMFIGKFSEEYVRNEKSGKKIASNKLLTDSSLIKWENKNNEIIINKARKLIWVAYNDKIGVSAKVLLADFDKHYKAIKDAEYNLYTLQDRHKNSKVVTEKEQKLQSAKKAFLNKMPKVFDPFAGGGAIPLEASRLGCRTYGNDINPVAHIIQKASLEFPQRFGKPIIYSRDEFVSHYGKHEWEKQPLNAKIVVKGEPVAVEIENRLAFDVEYYMNLVLTETRKKISHYYPKNVESEKIVAYYWVRTGQCTNPSCRAEVPLMKQFYLCNTTSKQVYLQPIIKGTNIQFEIKYGSTTTEGWISRGNMVCPCCKNTTENKVLKEQFEKGHNKQRLLAVIFDGDKGKSYRLPTDQDIRIIDSIPEPSFRPSDPLPVTYTKAMAFCLWGFDNWGAIFTQRQLIAINALVTSMREIEKKLNCSDKHYCEALSTYLALIIDKLISRQTAFGIIDTGRETIVDPFSKQAIQMVFDYPEQVPFSMDASYWVSLYIQHESHNFNSTICNNASSGDKNQFEPKSIDAVITDPPYYDAIAYADISDFFYIWLKQMLSHIYPLNFSTPQTPKQEECTALKHRFDEDVEKAKAHFEKKLLQIFDAIEHQTSDIISIMFAHQSTEAWTTLCNSILGSRMNITGSWANDTEATGALKTDKAFLSSSVTVSCRPSQRHGVGEFKIVRKNIEKTVWQEVQELYKLGFRGADLLTACFGQAVSEFGKYKKVEKADGTEVSVKELLDIAREIAFNAFLKGYSGDEFTKFYIGWLQLYGLTESEFGDLNNLVKVGFSIETSDLFKEHILVRKGSKQMLGTFAERSKTNKKLGEENDSYLIDNVHRAMALYKGGNRQQLLQYIAKVAASPESNFWRVATSLDELLPKGSEDQKQVNGLIINKDSLIRESKNLGAVKAEQTQMFE